MTDDQNENTRASTGALAGAGCFSAIAGFFGGGMIGTLVAKIAGSIQGCQPSDGIPACNWERYAFVGMIVGVVILPLISIIRLKSRRL
jgi:hypothetical protein